MTFFTITGHYCIFICSIAKNEVAFFRGIIVFIVVCSETQRYEKKSPIQRVEVGKNEIFDHIIVTNHPLLQNSK